MQTDAERRAAHLAAIVDSSDDAIVSKDLNGIITSWNRAAVKLFGYTPEEAVGRSIRMLIPADRQQEEDQVLARIRSGLMVDHFETVRLRKDGSEVDISLTVSPIRDTDGTIVGASKIARDISERKRIRAGLALAESERTDLQQRLMALTAASGTLLRSPRFEDVLPAILSLARELVTADGYAVWQLDPARDVWSIISRAGISDEFAAIQPPRQPSNTMTPQEPVVAEDVQQLVVTPDRRELYTREGIRSMLAIPLLVGSEITASLAFYYRHPHSFSQVEIQAARALGNLSAAALNTARLYGEQRRREVQARFLSEVSQTLARSVNYRQMLKSLAQMAAPDIADWCSIDIAGADGVLEPVALAHADPDKVTMAEEVRRRYPSDPKMPSAPERVMRSGVPALVSYVSDDVIESRARDAEQLAMIRSLQITSYICVPLRTRSGVIGAITFVTAESGRRYQEQDLRFAEAVADRAALAIENAMAYDEVHEASRLKDEFLATLSHELRTPLNAILGYTRMLRTGAVAPNRREKAIETVERNALSLAQMVDDVLDMSRVVAGKLAMQVKPIVLSKLIDDSIATVLPAAQAKGVGIRANVEPEVQTIVADADRLQQVLWNLLSNALKFTPRGGRITVDARHVEDQAEISVSDTGEGIPAEFLPHVFERFRQADRQEAGVRSGLGLGLAIARHIVEMHGGTIEAMSEGVGKGATFRVRLPMVSIGEPEPVI